MDRVFIDHITEYKRDVVELPEMQVCHLNEWSDHASITSCMNCATSAERRIDNIQAGTRAIGGIAPNQVIARSEFEVHLKCIWSKCDEGCDSGDWCRYFDIYPMYSVVFFGLVNYYTVTFATC